LGVVSVFFSASSIVSSLFSFRKFWGWPTFTYYSYLVPAAVGLTGGTSPEYKRFFDELILLPLLSSLMTFGEL